jgi:uncharacterized protein (DUF302 family)
MEQTNTIGLRAYLDTDFETAVARVTEALQAEGFGILTEIDMQRTLKQKIDVDFRPYRILGACNPPLAHRALSATTDVGLLLPCNVTVMQADDGRIAVGLLDPLAMMQMIDNPDLAAVAEDARARLVRVAAALNESQ